MGGAGQSRIFGVGLIFWRQGEWVGGGREVESGGFLHGATNGLPGNGKGETFSPDRMKWFFILCLVAGSFANAERPNFLWITSEDNAASWLGCYGNVDARTPRIDTLASEGLRFTRAYSNAPVCAVARSTILNGVHAVTQGTHHMRSRYPISGTIVPYVTAMRNAGYYCTNHTKTDYNFRGDDKALWDDSSNKAHYRNRPEGKPFLAVINLYETHEGSLFQGNIESNRKRGSIPIVPRVATDRVSLPPYLPDLPAIRSDIAVYHDNMTAMDRAVGDILDQLERDGLAGDTIVFYYSDHGGVLPRGKRYLEDSGTRVPLIVRIPEKWRRLSPYPGGSAVDELVSFVDLAPTLLSLAGVGVIPESMEGRPFLGPLRRDPPENDMVYLSADRFDEIPGMRRGITDGRWKYIRCFTPSKPAAPYSSYQFSQAGWTAWRDAWMKGELEPDFRALWEAPQPAERLYDLTHDPDEARDLTDDPAMSGRLQAMRSRLRDEMIRRRDAGLVPEEMYDSIVRTRPVAEYLLSRKGALADLVDLSLLSGVAEEGDLAALREQMKSGDPLVRYWAVHAVVTSPALAANVSSEWSRLLDDPEPAIRIMAAGHILSRERSDSAMSRLVEDLDSSDNAALNLAILAELRRIDALDFVPDSWIAKTLQKPDGIDPYPKRIARQLKEKRMRGVQKDAGGP